jgi:glycerol kinase
MAGLQAGFWSSKEEIAALRKSDAVFKPDGDATVANLTYQRWKKAVEVCRLFNPK